MWYRQAVHRWQYNTAHAYCILDTQGYKHTLGMCNNYCFSPAAVVARTRLAVTYITRHVAQTHVYMYQTKGQRNECANYYTQIILCSICFKFRRVVTLLVFARFRACK